MIERASIQCLKRSPLASVSMARDPTDMTETPASPWGPIRMTPEDLNSFLRRAFPTGAPDEMPKVMRIEPGAAWLLSPTSDRNLRPGGVISGPTLMSLADTAAYALILAHIGEVPMAVTTSLTIHFLRACKPGPLMAEARMLKLGRRIATCEVSMGSEGPDRWAAKATVAYALPDTSRKETRS